MSTPQVINVSQLLRAAASTAPPKPTLNEQQAKALNALKSLATTNIKTLDEGRARGLYTKWSAIEAVIKSPIDGRFKTKGDDVTLLCYVQFKAWYRDSIEKRFIDSLKDAAFAPPPPPIQHVEVATSGWKLKPQQRKGVDMTVSVFTDPSPIAPHAIMLPWATGRGKTFAIGGAILALKQLGKLKGHPLFKMFPPVLYLTKNRVVRATKRKMAKMGLTERDVLVLSYSQLSTKHWRRFFTDEVEIRRGEEAKVFKWALYPFELIVLDECQDVKNPDCARTKRVEGLLRAEKAAEVTRVIAASATPFVTLEDTRMFCIAARFQFCGEIVNNDNFVPFVRQFVYQAGGRIDKPNVAALERFKDFCGAAVVAPPNDPVKTKVYNTVKLIEFPDDAHRSMYATAEAAYVRAVENSGGNAQTSQRGEILRAFTIYARAEELCKCPYWADYADQVVKEGNTAVLGCRFQDSVKSMVGLLAKKGYTRADISVIWGGSKIIKESECFTPEEFSDITYRENQARDAAREAGTEHEKLAFLSKKEKTKYRKTVLYMKDRLFKQESKAQARERVAWLDAMMLHPQDEEMQDAEVEAFLEGRTKICIFTLAAGGIGIDLDHQRETARPRRGSFTICYWAEEFVQSAGRDWRPASSITDTYNEFVFIRNTIAADHIAPKLAKKVSSINAIGQSGIDFEELLTTAVAKKLEAERLDIGAPEGSDEEIDESIIDIEDDDEE